MELRGIGGLMRRRKPISTLGLIADLLKAIDKSDHALNPAERLAAAIDAEDIHSDLGIRFLAKRKEVESGGVSGKIAQCVSETDATVRNDQPKS